MPSLASERFGVQNPLIRYAGEVGWSVISREDALTERGGESGTLFYKTLERKLVELNPGVITAENVDEVIRRIEGVRASIEGNAEILAWLRGERTVYVASEKRHRNVTVVDFEHIAHNVFQVTDEWRYTNGQHGNRADVMFVLNGIPVALVETKGASKADAIEVGIDQVRRYHRETPELLAAPQVFDVTRLVDFYYGATWNLDRKDLFNWKDEESGNFERKVKRFFGRERFLKLLSDWIIVFRKDDELRKIVLRQHQTRGVEKVVARALDPDKTRGLVWHTQGSGKTFTMITAAEQILGHAALKNEKPTVLMLVDRNELESQLFQNLTAYGLPYEQATSKRRLRELFKSDYRGLIVAMVHKFEGADANLSTRDNIFVLVDEAHRTTGGDLGNYLVAALPNATLIGFTGTPIDKTAYGKGTFKVFGVDDPRGYLDKYSIAESIEDGTTLPLRYTLAPNEVLVPREQLEREFLSLTEAEGVSDIEELNKILDHAVNLKSFLKTPDRVAKVAAFVAQHFRENVEPLGYKAFLVGVDREACALYKHALDQHLPPEYSAVVLRTGSFLGLSLVVAIVGAGVANAQTAQQPPTISYIAPTSVNPGATVYVYGSSFDSASVVALDGTYGQAVNPAAVAQGGGSLSFVLPANVGVGTHSVQIEEKASNFPPSNSVTLTVVMPQQPPAISYISPVSVSPGATVYVYGSNFDSASVVALDGTYGQAVNPTAVAQGGGALSFVLPANVGVGTHSVQIEEKASSFSPSNSVTLTVVMPQQPPTISSIAPTTVYPGATVYVYGSNFDNASVVALDGTYGQAVNPTSVTQGGGSLAFVLPANVGVGTHSVQIEEKASNFPPSNSVTLTVSAPQTNAPSVTLLSPNGGETLTQGTPYTVTWTTSNFGSLAIELDLVNTGGYVVKNIALNLPNTGSYTWTPDATIVQGSYRMLIGSQDKGPSAQAYSSGYFTVAASGSPTPAPVGVGSGTTSIQALQQQLIQVITLLLKLLMQAAAQGALTPGQLSSALSVISAAPH